MTPIELGVIDAYAEHNAIPWEQAATLGTLDDMRQITGVLRHTLPVTLHTSASLRAVAKCWALAYMAENATP